MARAQHQRVQQHSSVQASRAMRLQVAQKGTAGCNRCPAWNSMSGCAVTIVLP
jgi:hypothetical protein